MPSEGGGAGFACDKSDRCRLLRSTGLLSRRCGVSLTKRGRAATYLSKGYARWPGTDLTAVIQEGVEPCCTPKPDPRSKDWVGSLRTSLLAWWLPTAAIIAGLFAPIPARTIIWTVALVWMGIACVL